ncbi:MAG: CADD family putative folate metabolism protein, partial [Anaerolineae bacterium]
MGNNGFIRELEDRVRQRHVLTHPLYETWTAGALTREALQGYAREYYRWVEMFPRFVSAVHSNCPNPEVRRRLLDNLSEEERPDAPHSELWLRFAEGLGLSRQEIDSASGLAQTEWAIDTVGKITRDGSFQEGTAALWAYESQVPEVAIRKAEGLREHYGVTEPEALRYFTVHAEVDVDHARQERQILEEHVRSSQQERAVS